MNTYTNPSSPSTLSDGQKGALIGAGLTAVVGTVAWVASKVADERRKQDEEAVNTVASAIGTGINIVASLFGP